MADEPFTLPPGVAEALRHFRAVGYIRGEPVQMLLPFRGVGADWLPLIDVNDLRSTCDLPPVADPECDTPVEVRS